jgi:pimeloyl-ACP methyl ester carboxylesterase
MSPCRIETFAAAYSAVIEQAFADRRIVVLGVSAGALAALVLDAANVEALVLVEPFFSTAKLWTLVEALRSIFPNIDPAQRDWAWDVLGIAETRLEDRPYGHLLPPALPNCVVVVGDIPLLPRRPMPTLPSFTDDGDRAALVASGARLIEVAGGHAVPRNAPEAITAALEDVLRTLT